jgi:hypothetical protein
VRAAFFLLHVAEIERRESGLALRTLASTTERGTGGDIATRQALSERGKVPMNARVWPWMLGLLLFVFTQTVAQEVCAEPTPPRPPMPDTPLVMPEEFYLALFDGVGQAISELYLFEDFNGLDWEAVLDEFARSCKELCVYPWC